MMQQLIVFAFLMFLLPACKAGPAPAITSSSPDLRREAIIGLSDSSKASQHFSDFATLINSDTDYLVRAQAAVALGKLKDPKAVPYLTTALSDSIPYVRIDSANALGNIGNPLAIPVLKKNLVDDPSPHVRRACAKALGNIGTNEPIETLIRALDDVDLSVSDTAYQSLCKITKQSLPKRIGDWKEWHNKQK
jgi:hypothetical protein